MWKFSVFFLVLTFLTEECFMNELSAVIVLYRHGDRSPVKSYKYDMYDESYWPEGFGQLTNIGKQQHYSLGKWLRHRYDGFISPLYDRKEVKVFSSNKDRCLMSAGANLAGLYPPRDHQVWNKKVPWQPIPIHTTPEDEDALLAQRKPCPKYNRLFVELMNTEEFADIFREHSDLLDYLSVNSGETITSFDRVKELYDTLFVEDLYNLTLPLWTRSVFPDRMTALLSLVWTSYTHTSEMARLKTGPLLDYLVSYLENVALETRTSQRFLMLSAHDSTIAYLLNGLNVFNNLWPPYAACVIFELRKGVDAHYVNILYKNSTEPMKLTLPNCNFNCGLDKFKEIISPVRLSLNRWIEECYSR